MNTNMNNNIDMNINMNNNCLLFYENGTAILHFTNK